MSEVVTGDAVVLEVTAATFPSRLAARLIDMIGQVIVLVLVLIVVSTSTSLSTAATGTVITVSLVLIIVGYPTISETLSRGWNSEVRLLRFACLGTLPPGHSYLAYTRRRVRRRCPRSGANRSRRPEAAAGT